MVVNILSGAPQRRPATLRAKLLIIGDEKVGKTSIAQMVTSDGTHFPKQVSYFTLKQPELPFLINFSSSCLNTCLKYFIMNFPIFKSRNLLRITFAAIFSVFIVWFANFC